MRYFAYIIFLWLFYGCSSKAKNGLKEVSGSYAKAPLLCRLDTTFTEIDMRQKKSSISTSREDIEYTITPIILPDVNLEARSYIHIDKVIPIKDKMILIDSRVGDRVDIISRDGSSLASINDKGGRYEDLIDATFSTIDSLIIIDSQEELLYYNLQGEFVKSAKAPWDEYIEAIGDKLVRQTKRSHLCSNQVNELISLSTEEITVRKGIVSEAISRLSEIVKGRITARNSNDELLIKPSYCDTIYALCSDSTFYVKYVTNFGEDSFWQEYATTIEDSITSKIFNSH